MMPSLENDFMSNIMLATQPAYLLVQIELWKYQKQCVKSVNNKD